MSARSKKSRIPEADRSESSKKTTLTDRSKVSSANESNFESFNSSRHERSASPLNITRTDEKEELSHLNDRLAQYIDYVRKLEKDKEVLKRRINSFSDERISRANDACKTYEAEIASLRNLVDDIAKQKASCDVELKKHKDDSSDAKAKLSKRELELRNLQRKFDTMDRDISGYKQDAERYSQLKPEYDALEKRLELLRRDLEAETILRTDLENKVAGLREEIDFKNRLFDEEREKLISRTVMIEEEVEDRKAAEFENRLSDELQAYRQQTADELQAYRSQMELTFQNKLDQLRAANADSSIESQKLRDEILILRKRSDDLSHELAKKTAEVDLLKGTITDLEKFLNRERDDHERQLQLQRDEVKRLQLELEQRFSEFTDLMNTKIALDQEILMYRKMLEGEESRLNIASPPRDSVFGMPSSKKRRLEVGDYEEGLSSSEFPDTRYAYRVSTSSTGNIEFSSEQDGQGRWVKLFNSSDKDVSLGNLVLKQQVDGLDFTFKFHRTLTLKPEGTCTIWSSNAGATHNPPSDVVMKNQSFLSGESIKMQLINSDGLKQASCLILRERNRATAAHFRSGHARSASTTSNDKCSLM